VIDCKHWKDIGESTCGQCTLAEAAGLFGERPSHGVCKLACSYRVPTKDPVDEPSKPGVARQIANATKAAARVTRNAVTGRQVLVSGPVRTQRLQVCTKCPSGKFRTSDQTCADCGCPVRRKSRYASETCPFGHWPTTEEPAKAVATFRKSVLTAAVLVENEVALLEVMGSRSTLAAAFDGYHTTVNKAACTGCARNAAGRVLMSAFVDSIKHTDDEARRALAEMLSTYTIIQGQAKSSLPELLNATYEAQDELPTV